MVPCNIGEINQVVLNLVVNGAHAIRDRLDSKSKEKLLLPQNTINLTIV